MLFSKMLAKLSCHCKNACRLAVSSGTPARAAKLAVVVGTLLVLINQWEAVIGAGTVDWTKVVLTYCVPYLVSTYTGVSKDLHALNERFSKPVDHVVPPENRVRSGL